MDLPLAGVRILAVEQYGAGPYGTMHLADLGAEVIKIEPPGGGDMSRQTGPFLDGAADSLFFQAFNRNKRSLALDLKSASGRKIFEKLVATADGLLDNLRGDQPDKLGLTHTALASINPKLVCVHLSAFGRANPRASWPGYDYLMQAEAGWLHLTGEPGSVPTRAGLSLVDYMAGVTAALAMVSGILAAMRTGQGRDLEVSLYDVAMQQLSYPAVWYLNEGHVTERRPRSGHPATVPVELLPTADGWIFVMCVTQKFWEALAEGAGHCELVTDPRFATAAGRRENRDALMAILDPTFRTCSTEVWLERFAGTVPAAPVRSLGDAIDNPFFRDRAGVAQAPHPSRGSVTLLAPVVRASGDTALPVRAAPALGQDNAAILAELGIAESDP